MNNDRIEVGDFVDVCVAYDAEGTSTVFHNMCVLRTPQNTGDSWELVCYDIKPKAVMRIMFFHWMRLKRKGDIDL